MSASADAYNYVVIYCYVDSVPIPMDAFKIKFNAF